MRDLSKIKAVIKEHISSARCGIFDCRNIVGDRMTNIYDDGDVQIDIYTTGSCEGERNGQ